MEKQAAVRARLKRVFETEGGHCFGQFQ
jgi:hypothetical protein